MSTHEPKAFERTTPQNEASGEVKGKITSGVDPHDFKAKFLYLDRQPGSVRFFGVDNEFADPTPGDPFNREGIEVRLIKPNAQKTEYKIGDGDVYASYAGPSGEEIPTQSGTVTYHQNDSDNSINGRIQLTLSGQTTVDLIYWLNTQA